MNRKSIILMVALLLLAVANVPVGRAQDQDTPQQQAPCSQEGTLSFLSVGQNTPIRIITSGFTSPMIGFLVTVVNESTDGATIDFGRRPLGTFQTIETIQPGRSATFLAPLDDYWTRASSQRALGRYSFTTVTLQQQAPCSQEGILSFLSVGQNTPMRIITSGFTSPLIASLVTVVNKSTEGATIDFGRRPLGTFQTIETIQPGMSFTLLGSLDDYWIRASSQQALGRYSFTTVALPEGTVVREQ